MLKKVVISPNNSRKALDFFEDINRRKEESKKRFAASTARLRERLAKKTN